MNPITNVFSPYSVGRVYVGRDSKGFFVTPKSDAAPSGWGFPLTDQAGNSIIPGTIGGPNPVKFIWKNTAGKWKAAHSPGTQLFGEVSWLGKPKDPLTTSKGKWAITYHGPTSRYFPQDAFSYGDSSHHNVYCEGRCIAVAPYPVLGAALRQYTDQNSLPKFRLVAVCWDGNKDVVYMREINPMSGATAITYDAAFRTDSMAFHDPQTNVNGWRNIGDHTCKTSGQGTSRVVKNPRTPWFFDSTGTICQCMREADITFNRGDKNVTQQGYVRYKITVNDNYSTLAVPDNLSGFTITTNHNVSYRGTYTATVPFPWNSGYPARAHTWDCYKCQVTVDGTGKYVVAVDYDDTAEVLMNVEMRVRRSQTQWHYIGIDPTGPADSNNNDRKGELWQVAQPGFVPTQENGQSSMWVAIDDGLYLTGKGLDKFFLYRRLTGSLSEFNTGTADPNDVFVYYNFDVCVYPHYMNMPRPHFAFYTEDVLTQFSERFPTYNEFYRKGIMSVSNPVKFMEKKDPSSIVSTGFWATVDMGWLTTDLLANWAGGVSTRHIFKSYDGQYPKDYVHPASEPAPASGYFGTAFNFADSWPKIPDLLQLTAKCYREGQLAEDSKDNFIASIKYLDHAGVVSYYNVLNEDATKLGAVTSTSGAGLRFYPLGES